MRVGNSCARNWKNPEGNDIFMQNFPRNKILHLFYGDCTFHVKNMIPSLIRFHGLENHAFLIYVTQFKLVQEYKTFLANIPQMNAKVIYLGPHSYRPRGAGIPAPGIFGKLMLLKQDLLLCWKIRTENPEVILVHGYFRLLVKIFLVLSCASVSWVNWGTQERTYGIKRMIYSWIYQRFYVIICLQESDKAFYQKNYPKTRLVQKNYLTSFPAENKTEMKKTGKHILLGNSAFSINDYRRLLSILHSKHFSSSPEMTCMMNYGGDPDEVIAFKKEVHKQYPTLQLWEEIVPIDEYMKFIQKIDIYLCANQSQSSLGAIYACLNYGKKIFLNGSNYTALKDDGFHIFHIRELAELSGDEICRALPAVEVAWNMKTVQEKLSSDVSIAEWDTLYSEMQKESHRRCLIFSLSLHN